MVCFTVLIIIHPSTLDVKSKVQALMLPYDSSMEVEPYKEYLNREELLKEINYLKSLPPEAVDKIAKDWKMETNDLEKIAKMQLKWFDEVIDGVDEKGEYKIVTYNPNGKWDWYKFLDLETAASHPSVPHPFKVCEIPEFVPYAIVTPDGKWYELGEDAGLEAFVNREIKKIAMITENEINWKHTTNLGLFHSPGPISFWVVPKLYLAGDTDVFSYFLAYY